VISDVNIKVDRDLCYACGICVERCIMDNLRLSVAPCRQACPIDMNCQGYVRLIAQGREREAAEEMRLHTPFGAILGRVCSHPCEGVCERGKIDGPVHIRALKRYLADSFSDVAGAIPSPIENTGRRIAVVGSGPAGLTAAFELQSQGHQVTIFESSPEPGGLLRYGIPHFRLPSAEIERVVAMLERMGISFRTGESIGQRIEFERLEQEWDAVIIAVGPGSPKRLGLPGEGLSRVIQGIDLLRQVREGTPPLLGSSVIVIGGGNSAVDAALTCRKLGVSEIRMACLERPSEMPAFALELEEAKEEGITIEHCWGPRRILDHGGHLEVEFSRCLSVFDDNGCFSPILEQTYGLSLCADSVVLAVGQEVEAGSLPRDLLDPETGRLFGDPLTAQSSSREKIFVCGDGSAGSRSVVEAMASAKKAAISVDRFVRGDGLRWGRTIFAAACVKEFEVDRSRAQGGPRGKLDRVAVGDRNLHTEVERTISGQKARLEAERCLSCGRAAEINRTCWYCLPCEIECPVKALEVRIPYLVR